jgi:Rrf2 family protein
VISQTAEYALRAVVHLSMADGALTTQDIASSTKVPAGYLAKVLQSLARAGLLSSQRGLRGGFRVTRDPHDLTVLEVINAVDPIRRITACPLGLSAHGDSLCALHQRLDDAARSVEEAFGSATIADLLEDETESRLLCEFPRPHLD